ncbi:PhzF family phenazine biosynthesis protein [Vibrio methylphosphonaticus]|uniref:PhzF family phenazine biosynthesis protein n=1 Tax=Vibrio methylphosphonaticus TaxID=2946866 RepID=UPI00202A72C5|nr:PhzF family phenazine biosynthesis isomerase [Vibrio methylphosphonaticus]MCL9774902.1 PhzF family phenazine biosynthesis protein [Vibrio methylphosphonaticus]
MKTQWIVDAFTSEAFKGNSAAVMLVEEFPSEQWMQSVATENNLSETAYIKPIAPNHYYIRWFSPITEIDFCGHATLASAYVLYNYLSTEQGISATQTLRFSTNDVGDLTVKQCESGLIEMSFPNQNPKPIKNIPQALLNGLSREPLRILRNDQAYFAVYESEEDVTEIEANSSVLALLKPYDVVVTAPSDDPQRDFVSRYFWPASGGDEDPVTGSIHAGLGPYWGEQLGKTSMVALQASRRSGLLNIEISGERVLVSGNAVLFSKSQLYI